MHYRQDIEGCLSDRAEGDGLAPRIFESYLARANEACKRLAGEIEAGGHPFLTIAREQDDLASIEEALAPLREGLDDILFLGTGGSILGGWALQGLVAEPNENGRKPKLHFVYSIDPDYWGKLLTSLDLSRTGVVAISKSGGTAETLAQVMALLPYLKKASPRPLRERMLFVSEPGERPLRKLAEILGGPCLDHHPEIGGRYSVLSNVGVIPGLLAGVDMSAVRAGAASCLENCLQTGGSDQAAPIIGAAVTVALTLQRRVSQVVMMNYNDRLTAFGHWYRQLWSESLGKDGQGTTPIRAMGPLDQHSQLQLYLDGPRDKFFTLLFADEVNRGPEIDSDLAVKVKADYLAGHCLGDLLAAEAMATAESLQANGRPFRSIHMEKLDEESFGAVLMHFFLETVISADLLSVNPFDQPAVEDSKRRAREYLAKKRSKEAD
jgi:glucose-6-phosphate isomerase